MTLSRGVIIGRGLSSTWLPSLNTARNQRGTNIASEIDGGQFPNRGYRAEVIFSGFGEEQVKVMTLG